MGQGAEKASIPAADEALSHLLEAETWADLFAKYYSDPQRLVEAVERFRVALAGLGENYSEAEVRGALLRRAGLESPDAEKADTSGEARKGPTLVGRGANPVGSAAAPTPETTAENEAGAAWGEAWARGIKNKTMRYIAKYCPSGAAGVQAAKESMDAAEIRADAEAYLASARKACREARRSVEAEAAGVNASSRPVSPVGDAEAVREEPMVAAAEEESGLTPATVGPSEEPFASSGSATSISMSEFLHGNAELASVEEDAPEAPLEGDDLQPSADHNVYMNGKITATLLPSFYPSEMALQRAKHAFQGANPGRKIEVRRARRE